MSAPHTPYNDLVPTIPTIDTIRATTQKFFGRYPCLWQAQATLAVLRRKRDVIVKSGTGSGKTLTFWMPLLFSTSGIQVVITPLNLLGGQNEAELRAMKVSAIAINGTNVTHEKIQDICEGKYRVVVVNPEIALGAGSIFERVWKCEPFRTRVLSVIWDEAHCVSAWSSFRKEYKDAGRLRLLLGRRVPFYAASATLPTEVLTDVMLRLRMQQESTMLIERSNDRPNVYLAVRRIQHSLDSFEDLDFLVPKDWTPNRPLPKFLVFFDDIAESVSAAKRLRSRLPKEHRHLVKWFNSEMTPTFREYTTKQFKDGTGVCGLYTTDSFGLGMDVPDIPRVYQWRATCDLNTLWQRFGRAARGSGTEAVAVLFAESKYFDEEKEKTAIAAKARAEKAAAKAAVREKSKRALEDVSNSPPKVSKRTRVVESDVAESTLAGQLATSTSSHESVVSQPPSSLTVYEELRITYKSQTTKNRLLTISESTAVSSREPGPEMDAFINAASRNGHCFRLPIMAYYENDRRSSDHLLCSPEDPQGCARCNLTRTVVCCELCNLKALHPSPIFTTFLPQLMASSTVAPARPNAPRASRLPKFSREAADFRLRDALDKFRRQKMEEQYGHQALNTLSAGAIMGDDILERIADCAHCHRLRTVEDLKQQIPRWRRVEVYGAEILTLIHRYVPLPQLYTSTPLRSLGSTNGKAIGSSSAAEVPNRRTYKCKVCRQPGHRQRNGVCPLQAQHQIKENTAPEPSVANQSNVLSGPIFPSAPSYRQNSRVVRPGPELEALMLARWQAAEQ